MLFLFLLILAIPIGFIALMFYIFYQIIRKAVKTAIQEEFEKLKSEYFVNDAQN